MHTILCQSNKRRPDARPTKDNSIEFGSTNIAYGAWSIMHTVMDRLVIGKIIEKVYQYMVCVITYTLYIYTHIYT